MFAPFFGKCIKCPRGRKSLITTKRFLCHTHLQELKDDRKSPAKLSIEESKLKDKNEKIPEDYLNEKEWKD